MEGLQDEQVRMMLVELRAIRRGLAILGVIVVLCTAALIVGMWNRELLVLSLVGLGVLLIALIVIAVVGVSVGTAAGKAINRIRGD